MKVDPILSNKHMGAVTFIFLTAGFFLYGAFAWRLQFGTPLPVEAFWASLLFLQMGLLLNLKSRGVSRIGLVLLLSYTLLSMMRYAVLDTSPMLWNRDAIFEYQLDNLIQNQMHWTPGIGISEALEYSFYPATSFLHVTLASVTGIPLVYLVKYTVLVLGGLVTPLFVYFWAAQFFDKTVAYVGTLIFVTSFGRVNHPHHEVLALLFLAFAMYALVRRRGEATTLNFLIGLTALLALALTHHLSSFLMLSLITFLYVVGRLRGKTAIHAEIILSCWVGVAIWTTLVAYSFFLHTNFSAGDFFTALPNMIVSLLSSGATTTASSSTVYPILSQYTLYEQAIGGIGQAALFTCAILGLVKYIRAKNRSLTIMSLAFYMLVLDALAIPYRFTSSALAVFLSRRLIGFSYFSVAPLCAFFLYTLPRTKFKMLAISLIVLLVLMGGEIASPYNPRLVLNPVYTTDNISNYGQTGLLPADWMRQSAPVKYPNIIGEDLLVRDIFTGYAGMYVDLQPQVYFGNGSLSPRSFPTYVVVYADQTRLTPSLGGDPHLLSLYPRPLNETLLHKFDSPALQKVYDDGNMEVYSLSIR